MVDGATGGKQWVFTSLVEKKALVYDSLTGLWHGEPVESRKPITAEEILPLIEKAGKLTFTDWRHAYEKTYSKQSFMWSFIRAIKVLTDSGKVFKRDKFYVSASKAR